MITLRIDVDYPYPSRIRSFMYTALNIKTNGDYLRNSKIVARMINDSPQKVKAYWFFTLKTLPDRELLALTDNARHELALHIVNDPIKELGLLKQATGREIRYYTFHGTARVLARVMWKRWKTSVPTVPADFPLQSYHQFPKMGLDILCYASTTQQAVKIAENEIAQKHVLQIHPIWLFQKGKLNHRGPYYEVFKRILKVDADLETLAVRKRFFFKIARDATEYQKDITPTGRFIQKLKERGIDIFTFLERKWVHTIPNPPASWSKAYDNIALLHITSYDEWLKNIGKKTRNMIRKAEKSGLKTAIAEPDDNLAKGMWKIYNETPIRQERGFSHYGSSLMAVRQSLFTSQNCTYVAAFFQEELAGFVQLVQGENIMMISQILSMQKHLDKAVNNALVAKAVEVCGDKGVEWLMYGRVGNHPSLDNFKQNNGFTQFRLTRYYVPLSKRGRIAIQLGLYKELKDTLPRAVKYPLFPIYNWVSRTRMKLGLKLRPKQIT